MDLTNMIPGGAGEEQAVEQPEMFMMLNPPPVIYDEVQRAPNLFRYIKIKCDESDERGRGKVAHCKHAALYWRDGEVANRARDLILDHQKV